MISGNDKNALKKFGQRLVEIRKQKRLSQRKVSYGCNIDYSKIAKIEKGQINITFKTIVELSLGLEVHPKELFDYNFD